MSKNRIDITEQEAIDLKENITEEEKDLLKNAVKKEIRKKHRKKTKYMKAAAVAACVLIVAPTTIYGKEIQRFFQSKWKQNIFRMEVQVTKEKKSKQNVSLDTRNLKQYEVTKEKSKNETWYAFKNQKINNKDFYARLIKVDQTIKKKFFVNDVEKYSEDEISGNKVLILSMNNIDGKKDHKVYIFYEKEGYHHHRGGTRAGTRTVSGFADCRRRNRDDRRRDGRWQGSSAPSACRRKSL